MLNWWLVALSFSPIAVLWIAIEVDRVRRRRRIRQRRAARPGYLPLIDERKFR